MTGKLGHRDELGQAAVELALATPLVVVLLLALVQIILVGRDQVAVIHAAREAARAAAVAADPVGEAQRAARESSGLAPERLSVQVRAGANVQVSVSHRTPTDVPLVGGLIGDLTVQATATMRHEP
jgi:Flp pilus assembly protein TadG